jgi:two-component system, OmpR family, alkaline phosphatase synthesis response regulator PhoP
MSRILIVATENKDNKELAQALGRAGFEFAFVGREDVDDEISRNPPDLVITEVDGAGSGAAFAGLVRQIGEETAISLVAVVPREKLGVVTPDLPLKDFIVSPYEISELMLRVRRLLREKATGTEESGIIQAGELTIDLAKAEVTVAGHRVELTFREYELLRFLSSTPGRVFTREALLNKVWGYDYYGGDRTVDVHIRRLRSKIETDKLTFIETVRNIGYRFRDDLIKPQ